MFITLELEIRFLDSFLCAVYVGHCPWNNLGQPRVEGNHALSTWRGSLQKGWVGWPGTFLIGSGIAPACQGLVLIWAECSLRNGSRAIPCQERPQKSACIMQKALFSQGTTIMSQGGSAYVAGLFLLLPARVDWRSTCSLCTLLSQARAHSALCDRNRRLGGGALPRERDSVCRRPPFPFGAQCPYLSSRGPDQRPSRFSSRWYNTAQTAACQFSLVKGVFVAIWRPLGMELIRGAGNI